MDASVRADTLPEAPTSLPAESFGRLGESIRRRIVGQDALVDRLLVALLCDGHLLVEGAPGLAKTSAIKELAAHIDASFHRVQFTPDLLPADLTGTDVYRPQDGSFVFQRGPIFHNVVLADEVNRAPAKVQSALLEAMGERQVTVGRTTYALPRLYLVMATQNPIEQEGTYRLPEAQLDRFLLYVRIAYPAAEVERRILELSRTRAGREPGQDAPDPDAVVGESQVFAARREVLELHLAPALERYLIELVLATRGARDYGEDLRRWIGFGASPRASIALDRASRAYAWLHGRNYVSPEDIQSIAPDVLRHRLVLSYEAEAEGIDSERVVSELVARVPVP